MVVFIFKFELVYKYPDDLKKYINIHIEEVMS